MLGTGRHDMPPVMQVRGKRVLGVMCGIDGVLWAWRDSPGRLGVLVDREAQGLCHY